MNAPFRLSDRLHLFEGDAAATLGALPAACADMAYCDPPFGNEQVWRGTAGSFTDKWAPSAVSALGWSALAGHAADGAALFRALDLKRTARAYLGTIAGILIAVRRVLKPTGSLWLHFDDTMGAYLRMLGQAVFGLASECGTLVWKRTRGGHFDGNRFGRVHDTIACFTRSPCCPLWGYRFDDFAVAAPLASGSKERVGYPTQKPVALLEELILASTRPGDVVLDPTCGSGTALVAALRHGRRAIGIDVSPDAIACARGRVSQVSGQATLL